MSYERREVHVSARLKRTDVQLIEDLHKTKYPGASESASMADKLELFVESYRILQVKFDQIYSNGKEKV